VVRHFPHPGRVFTQGLITDGGTVWESAGGSGTSTLCRYELGAAQPAKWTPLPAGLFGEGICRVGDVIWQLTWKNRVALRWDACAIELKEQLSYPREGWGICAAEGYLVTSDGSGELVRRDPQALASLGIIRVRAAGRRLQGLNDLAWSEGTVWANVAGTHYLAGIDPDSGEVTDVVNARPAGERHRRNRQAIMNGIAALPAAGEFLLTGKGWRSIYHVRLEAARDRVPERLFSGLSH
jgi:glutamine cyclotransferase